MDKEQMKEEPKDWEFRSKPAWQRLIVMLGGVVVNLILGLIIFWFMTAYYGDKTLPMDTVNTELGIAPLEIGKKVGFEAGDKIISCNDQKLVNFSEAINIKAILGGQVKYIIERDGELKELVMPENFAKLITEMGKVNKFISYNSKFKVGNVNPESNAEKAGLMKGDKIVSVNGEEIEFYYDYSEKMDTSYKFSLKVNRGGEIVALNGETDKDGIFGFVPDISEMDELFVRTKYGFWESLPIGYNKAVETLTMQKVAFKAMGEGKISVRKSLMGPLQLATVFGPNWDWYNFWRLTGLFSLVLAIMNLLPIPGLDGGHAVFCTVEMLTGKTLSDKWMMYVHTAGMIILLALMVFIFGNDILRLFGI
jgi:regulator of sigma E protease